MECNIHIHIRLKHATAVKLKHHHGYFAYSSTAPASALEQRQLLVTNRLYSGCFALAVCFVCLLLFVLFVCCCFGFVVDVVLTQPKDCHSQQFHSCFGPLVSLLTDTTDIF